MKALLALCAVLLTTLPASSQESAADFYKG